MREVAAVLQRHAEHGVARIEQRKVDRQIRLRAGMWLDVGVIRMEQRLGALDGERFHHVHIRAAAVVPLAGIALGILVRQHAAHRRHHRRRGEVFRGDQLQIALLALQLARHCLRHGRVMFRDEAERALDALFHIRLPP